MRTKLILFSIVICFFLFALIGLSSSSLALAEKQASSSTYKLLSSTCGKTDEKDAEDGWNLQKSCTKKSGSEGNMHDENRGSNAEWRCSSDGDYFRVMVEIGRAHV